MDISHEFIYRFANFLKSWQIKEKYLCLKQDVIVKIISILNLLWLYTFGIYKKLTTKLNLTFVPLPFLQKNIFQSCSDIFYNR